ncbi:hypothetical protein RJ639_010402 [Escallonia herrerae]|uniref:Methyltransferase n=1 Tax=Escallonia herrerae TaxID=1293975 RepID=A0AA89ARX3_9ASTE|nr:hypothetical protein RJ639_010402 [Escallonia herrerae]
MKHKTELLRPRKKPFKYVLIGLIISLGLVCLYNGSSLAPGLRADVSDDGADPVIGGFVRKRDDLDDLFEDQEHNPDIPKNIPVCDMKYSELIPCLDRNLIYQLKLKPNLTLMEHYERHCPPPERRYNCLIPPPIGYKIPVRWPASRDEVWKANIPHTHLASEKSDQNWMVVVGDKIKFPGGGTHFHDGADKYISAIAGVYEIRTPGTHPPLCSSDDDPDANWNVVMKACITPYSAKVHREKGSGLEPWPKRLTAATPRLDEIGTSPQEFQEDTSIWYDRVSEYWKQMKSVIHKNSIRNVMDMNSNLGGFSAALKDKDVWVMNVAPVNASSRLKIIYDRGLIGTVHDWCESFSTYPRTYDLLHAWKVFSEIEDRGCSIEDLLIEMDRILRPDGFVIVRDRALVINYIRKFLTALRWDGWLLEVEPKTDSLSLSEERVLFARKKLWDEATTI